MVWGLGGFGAAAALLAGLLSSGSHRARDLVPAGDQDGQAHSWHLDRDVIALLHESGRDCRAARDAAERPRWLEAFVGALVGAGLTVGGQVLVGPHIRGGGVVTAHAAAVIHHQPAPASPDAPARPQSPTPSPEKESLPDTYSDEVYTPSSRRAALRA